jgi:hypothetical protein
MRNYNLVYFMMPQEGKKEKNKWEIGSDFWDE